MKECEVAFCGVESTLNTEVDHFLFVSVPNFRRLINFLTIKRIFLGCSPSDEGFKEFKEKYEQLSEDLEVLLEEKEQISLKIDCLRIADDGEMEVSFFLYR